MVTTTDPRTRAERLLAASDEPAGDWRDLDWNAAPVPGAPWQPWEQVSPFGTPLWDALDLPRRLELSRHECASVTAVGIWSENTLMTMLLRLARTQDARNPRARYALTEVADECRHSLMFARHLEALGTPTYGPGTLARRLTGAFAVVAHPVEIFASALVVEEILDGFQRASLADPDVQPLARAVDRIHVVEESRHMSFARTELRDRWRAASRATRLAAPWTIATAAALMVTSLVDPAAYAAVGLDPTTTVRAVRASKHRRALLRTAASRLTAELDDVGIITPAVRPVWRRAGLL